MRNQNAKTISTARSRFLWEGQPCLMLSFALRSVPISGLSGFEMIQRRQSGYIALHSAFTLQDPGQSFTPGHGTVLAPSRPGFRAKST